MRRALLAALALVVAASGQGYAGVDKSAETGRKRAQNQPLGTKEFRYRAFGERINLSGGAPSRTDPTFQNRTYDAGLGIYDYRNRSFDPATGRFLQRDPVLGGDPLYNPYCFPGNNPVTNGDPMGTTVGLTILLEDAYVPVPRPLPTPVPKPTPSVPRPMPGESLVPRTGESLAPRAGEQIVPKTGEQLAPKTGEQLVPKTGEELAPRTGERLAPKSGEQTAPRSTAKPIPPTREAPRFSPEQLREAARALRKNARFRDWFHRVYKKDMPKSTGRTRNRNLSPEEIREAFEEWQDMQFGCGTLAASPDRDSPSADSSENLRRSQEWPSRDVGWPRSVPPPTAEDLSQQMEEAAEELRESPATEPAPEPSAPPQPGAIKRLIYWFFNAPLPEERRLLVT